MIINYIHRVGWFVGLILLQVLILNNVHIAGVATPFLYVYFICIQLQGFLFVVGVVMVLFFFIDIVSRAYCRGNSETVFLHICNLALPLRQHQSGKALLHVPSRLR